MIPVDVDVAVIGGGAAGLVSAAGCAALGARTILIERDRLGGECTWTGCVPSKALLHIARQAALARRIPDYGIDVGDPKVDFRAVMRSIHRTREEIYGRDETPAHLKRLGIHPLKARARFLDSRTLWIERDGRGREVRFRRAVIATGCSPFVPPIQGLDSIPYHTSRSIFEIDELPERLAILGGGAVGVELAQAFARLGSRVTLMTRDDHLLPGADRWAARALAGILTGEGVELRFGQTIGKTRPHGGAIHLSIEGKQSSRIDVDGLLIATGRRPCIEDLDLGAADVRYDRSGVEVDAWCRASARRIYAAGDVTPAPNFTHVAENMARAAALNAITGLPVARFESQVIPRVTFTDPEVAEVGQTQNELDASGTSYDVIELPFEKVDRAVLEHRAVGAIRVYHHLGTVLGATIVGPEAGELIAEYALAMKHGLRLHDLAGTLHAYPTMMLGARRAADQFYLRLLRRWMVRGVRLAYGYRGDVPDYIGTDRVI